MIAIGDTVKITGLTDCGGFVKECIKIGTICRVVGTQLTETGEVTVAVVPVSKLPYRGFEEYWYLKKDVEKGHMEWVKDE